MKPDLIRSIAIALAWVAITVGVDLILTALVPGLDRWGAGLLIIALISVLVATGVTWAGWWSEVGYTPVSQWRNKAWLLVPALITLIPLLSGIRPMDASTYGLLIAGYVLTGFAEETVYRGVLLKLLSGRSALAAAGISALLFGATHLGNIVVRGEVVVTFAQAVGAAAFGFGFAALRLRTNTILPLVVLHAVHDLFLQMGNWPLIPVAVAQDILLFALGLWLLRDGFTRRRN